MTIVGKFTMVPDALFDDSVFKNTIEACVYVHMLKNANWADGKGKYSRLLQNQLQITFKELGALFDWSESKMRRFCVRLQESGLIEMIQKGVKRYGQGTIITLKKYCQRPIKKMPETVDEWKVESVEPSNSKGSRGVPESNVDGTIDIYNTPPTTPLRGAVVPPKGEAAADSDELIEIFTDGIKDFYDKRRKPTRHCLTASKQLRAMSENLDYIKRVVRSKLLDMWMKEKKPPRTLAYMVPVVEEALEECGVLKKAVDNAEITALSVPQCRMQLYQSSENSRCMTGESYGFHPDTSSTEYSSGQYDDELADMASDPRTSRSIKELIKAFGERKCQ